jgi:hypothetical protein
MGRDGGLNCWWGLRGRAVPEGWLAPGRGQGRSYGAWEGIRARIVRG